MKHKTNMKFIYRQLHCDASSAPDQHERFRFIAFLNLTLTFVSVLYGGAYEEAIVKAIDVNST